VLFTLRWLPVVVFVAAAPAAADVPASALLQPIRSLPGLKAISIHEVTYGDKATSYAPNAPQLARRADPLSASNNDFTFYDGEYYDVFYSDEDGRPDPNGAFVTVEGVWRNADIKSGGMNIAEIELQFDEPEHDFADFVASFVMGSYCDTSSAGHCNPGSEGLVVDHSLGTFPRFGHTSEQNPAERFRITVGFSPITHTYPGAPPHPIL